VRSGGFGLLSVHTQNYVEGGLMLLTMGEYMRKVASYKDRLWVARGDQITAWWRQREAVKVEQRFVKNSLHVALQNTAPLQGLTVLVTLPHKDATVRVAAATSGAIVKVKPLDSFRAALVFDTLPAGRTQLRVDFR
jgi:streptomycin 6-kinase